MLRDQHTRLETRHQTVATDLASERTKSKNLNDKLSTSELRANELQKKYDDCKRNYFKIRDERERLKADVEKASTKGGEAMIRTGSVDSAAAAVNGVAASTGEVQAKYESLKTKYRVADETAKAADKRSVQMEEEVKAKNE